MFSQPLDNSFATSQLAGLDGMNFLEHAASNSLDNFRGMSISVAIIGLSGTADVTQPIPMRRVGATIPIMSRLRICAARGAGLVQSQHRLQGEVLETTPADQKSGGGVTRWGLPTSRGVRLPRLKAARTPPVVLLDYPPTRCFGARTIELNCVVHLEGDKAVWTGNRYTLQMHCLHQEQRAHLERPPLRASRFPLWRAEGVQVWVPLGGLVSMAPHGGVGSPVQSREQGCFGILASNGLSGLGVRRTRVHPARFLARNPILEGPKPARSSMAKRRWRYRPARPRLHVQSCSVGVSSNTNNHPWATRPWPEMVCLRASPTYEGRCPRGSSRPPCAAGCACWPIRIRRSSDFTQVYADDSGPSLANVCQKCAPQVGEFGPTSVETGQIWLGSVSGFQNRIKLVRIGSNSAEAGKTPSCLAEF